MPTMAPMIGVVILSALLCTMACGAEDSNSQPASAGKGEARNRQLAGRLLLTVGAIERDMAEAIAEIDLDLAQQAAKLGLATDGAANKWLLRMEEVDAADKALEGEIIHQYDQPGTLSMADGKMVADGADGAHAAAGADAGAELIRLPGRLSWIMPGETRAGTKRTFRLYFGPVQIKPADKAEGDGGRTDADAPEDAAAAHAGDAAGVRLVETKDYQGQTAFCIRTESGTYWYHKDGAGFASLIDSGGNDWISYRPGGGAAGEYRGIPNLVYPDGYFHPGGKKCRSQMAATGPLRATIVSDAEDGRWRLRWDIYPKFARLTVLRAAKQYWFLYEGTPGGKLDERADGWQRSDGQAGRAAAKWDKRLASPRWVAFSDGPSGVALYLAHHDDDGQADSYWPMQGQMTVFGFGRSGLKSSLRRAPARFTIGLLTREQAGRLPATMGQVVDEVTIEAAGSSD